MSAKEELLKLGINAWDDTRPKDDPDYMPIDYSFSDGGDAVAWLWGQRPSEIEWECNHPECCMEWGDDDETGECLLCGAQCTWHYNVSADDGYETKERVPDEWSNPSKPEGLLGKCVKEMAEK